MDSALDMIAPIQPQWPARRSEVPGWRWLGSAGALSLAVHAFFLLLLAGVTLVKEPLPKAAIDTRAVLLEGNADAAKLDVYPVSSTGTDDGTHALLTKLGLASATSATDFQRADSPKRLRQVYGRLAEIQESPVHLLADPRPEHRAVRLVIAAPGLDLKPYLGRFVFLTGETIQPQTDKGFEVFRAHKATWAEPPPPTQQFLRD